MDDLCFAVKDEDGYPECLCPWHLGFEHEDCSGKHCHECWNKPIE